MGRVERGGGIKLSKTLDWLRNIQMWLLGRRVRQDRERERWGKEWEKWREGRGGGNKVK